MAACHTQSKAFFKIDKDLVQDLLMLEVLFTQYSKVDYLFYGAHFGSGSGCSKHRCSKHR